MKYFFLPLSALLLVFAGTQSVLAAEGSIFDKFYEEAKTESKDAYPSPKLEKFVIEEMKDWNGHGITLTSADVRAAVDSTLSTANDKGLCQKKTDAAGKAITLAMGADLDGSGCFGLQSAILTLINNEKEADWLANDLLMITNGSELTIADEPHRPLSMATVSMLIRHVWSGTGGGIIPWDGTADTEVTALESALNALKPEDLDAAVLRFHHGYYRDNNDADPRFQGIADPVGTALKDIATKLAITDDPKHGGEYATPELKVPNVALWIRGDDLGIHWVYPTHTVRLTIEVADDYPTFIKAASGSLAYPFEFTGTLPLAKDRASPLCSRTTGRYGYLCSPLPEDTVTGCTNTATARIALVQCSKKVTTTKSGPDICPELKNLFTDDGTPFTDPANPARLNPALKPADRAKICQPPTKTDKGARVTYVDDISSHACYISFCLAASMSGHTIIPNRNAVLVNEQTSPYLSCVRADPELGLYSEVAVKSPYPLPPYIGHELVQDFERAYCAKNGDAPRAILSDCNFRSDSVAVTAPSGQSAAMETIIRNAVSVAADQAMFLSLGAAIGERMAVDQTIVVQQKLFAGVASFIRQIADTLTELERAPLTTVACPWTGPFKKFGT